MSWTGTRNLTAFLETVHRNGSSVLRGETVSLRLNSNQWWLKHTPPGRVSEKRQLAVRAAQTAESSAYAWCLERPARPAWNSSSRLARGAPYLAMWKNIKHVHYVSTRVLIPEEMLAQTSDIVVTLLCILRLSLLSWWPTFTPRVEITNEYPNRIPVSVFTGSPLKESGHSSSQDPVFNVG